MESGNFDIVNWKIKNFSCWNQALHEKYLETHKITLCNRSITMNLYPRGISGLERRMAIHLSITANSFAGGLFGNLLFIGSDGSTLSTQQVHHSGVEKEFSLELPPGPKFEEVIHKIRENESDYKDQLTLILQVKSNQRDESYVKTTIDVFEVNLKVDRLLKGDQSISYIRCVHDDYDRSIYLNINRRDQCVRTKLYLDNSANDSFPYSVQTQLILISNDGSIIRKEGNEHVFYEIEEWTFSDSLTEKELSENFKSLNLRFKIISGKVSNCLQNVYLFNSWDVKYVPNRFKNISNGKSHEIRIGIDSNYQGNSVNVLLKELECLYQDQDFSDLQIKCGAASFPAHKSILSARSPVFKKMLSSDMSEAASGIVVIEDLEAETLVRFLRFLYTGTVGEDLPVDVALKLYYAADKYEVTSLKKKCAVFLKCNTSASNACNVLLLGHRHGDEELISAANKFILGNFKEFLKSKEWEHFFNCEPILAVKTVTHFASEGYVGNLYTQL